MVEVKIHFYYGLEGGCGGEVAGEITGDVG